MMQETFVLFSSMGEMTVGEVVRECGQEGWIPTLCWYENDKVIVPYFTDKKVAFRFAKRNITGKTAWGMSSLTDIDIKWAKNQGWEMRHFSYPSLVSSKFELGIERLWFNSKPEVKGFVRA